MAGANTISILVTSRVVGYSFLKNYKNATDQTLYLVPTYRMILSWIGRDGKLHACTYEVIRFGIDNKGPGSTGSVCGCLVGPDNNNRKSTYTVAKWNPTYTLQSRSLSLNALHFREGAV